MADLPQFLVIGSMKSGTTSLHRYLRVHPALYLPPAKELNFFVAEHNWSRGVSWYRRQFRHAPVGAVSGEVSPDYSKHPAYAGVPERIRAVIPDAKLVYLVRHPIERMQSMYLHRVATGRESRPADVALLQDAHYFDCSCYANQIQQYLACFPEDQIIVATTERLRRDRQAVMDGLFSFLGVAPLPAAALPIEEYNRADERGSRRLLGRVAARLPYRGQLVDRLPSGLRRAIRGAAYRPIDSSLSAISPTTEAVLRERLASDVADLRRFIGDAVDDWGIPSG